MPIETLVLALEYSSRGWAPIPIPLGQKAPALKDWPNVRLTAEDLETHFAKEQNIGILLGKPSGGLIDIDLDTAEAVRLAPEFLPDTGAVFGRPGNPRSHWLYLSDAPSTRFRDIDGTTLVEIRSTGSQTVFPPSIHSDERVSWQKQGDARRLLPDELTSAVSRVAAASLIARHWPTVGSRQDAALALAGCLLRAGWSFEMTAKFIFATATAAGDDEPAKRASAVENTDARIAAGQKTTGRPTLAGLIGEDVEKRVGEWLGIDDGHQSPQVSSDAARQRGSVNGREKPSQAQTLVELADSAELFHTPEGEAFAVVQVNDHFENWPVRSKVFKEWLVRAFYAASAKPPGNQALQDAISVLESKARFDGPVYPVYLRVGHHEDAIYVDLGSANWDAVEITAAGWRVVSKVPVHFRRSKGMLGLPNPVRGGSIGVLRPYVNVADDRAWRLIVAFLLGAYRPSGPYPVLILEGEAGSAKSTVSRMLRSLVDPFTAPLRTLPRDERDLAITARNGWLLNFDNLSHLSPAMSDALCRVATGGGLSTRELYSDSEEAIFEAQRPIILNGIDDVASRADLADRALVISLSRIADEHRRPESALRNSFASEAPLILGALLDGISSALRNENAIRLPAHPRMADFAIWVTAAEPALGWPSGVFLDAYREQRRDTAASGLDSDPVVLALAEFLSGEVEWIGTATELLHKLNRRADESQRRSRVWLESARSLADRIRRAAPFFRDLGIEIEFDREPGTRRRLLIFRHVPPSNVPIVPTGPDLDDLPDGNEGDEVCPDLSSGVSFGGAE